MRISFIDLGNVFAHICTNEAYAFSQAKAVQKWVSTVEGIDLTMRFNNRKDQWILSTSEACIAFTFDMKIIHIDPSEAIENGMVKFGKSWGIVGDCVYWGDADKVAALLVMLKIMVPPLYTNDHTYAEFVESPSRPDAD